MRSILTAWMGLSLLLAFAGGCANQITTSDQDIKTLTVEELKKYLEDTKKPAVLIDPRPEAKYAQGHLAGSVNIPLPQIVARDPRLGEASRIIVYASGWNDYLSTAAAKRMLALGYANVYDFRGGIELWQQTGGALETAE